MATTALLVMAQIAGRLIDRFLAGLGMERLGLAIPSLAEFGGFLFVGAAFLALPATFRAGDHIRVTLLSRAIPKGVARALDAAMLGLAAIIALYGTWHCAVLALDSLRFGSVSYGVVPVPLALPQSVLTLGLALFAVSLLDDLATFVGGGEPAFRRAEAAKSRTERIEGTE